MVTINEGRWQAVLDQIDKGEVKASVMESLLNDGFSVLEADAIYYKARGELDHREKPKPPKQSMANLRRWLQAPSVRITSLAIIIGTLLPLFFAKVLHLPFSAWFGFAWMVYVLGTWVGCLAGGNIPGVFGLQDAIFVAKCRPIGSSTSYAELAMSLGGILISLVLGFLLVIYMIRLSQSIRNNKDAAMGAKKTQYVSAWFNGTVGISMLVTLTMFLFSSNAGQIGLDTLHAAQIIGMDAFQLKTILGIVLIATLLGLAMGAMVLLIRDKKQ